MSRVDSTLYAYCLSCKCLGVELFDQWICVDCAREREN
jgi:hypothetical protein